MNYTKDASGNEVIAIGAPGSRARQLQEKGFVEGEDLTEGEAQTIFEILCWMVKFSAEGNGKYAKNAIFAFRKIIVKHYPHFNLKTII